MRFPFEFFYTALQVLADHSPHRKFYEFCPLLKIHLHLSNGNTHRFVQNSAESAQQILDGIKLRIFQQPNLIISGDDMVATYPAPTLNGLSLLSAALPEKLLHLAGVPQSGITKMRSQMPGG